MYVGYPCDPNYDLHADVEHRLSLGVPHWVVVEFGTNDALTQSLDELTANYVSKIQEYVSWWPESVHIFWVNVAYMPCCPDDDANIDAVNGAIDQVAANDPRVTVIDLHSAFLDHLTDWWDPDDGVHYNQTGRQAYADLICEAVGEWVDGPDGEQCPPLPTTTTTTTTSTTTTSTTVPDTTPTG
jgi:lysophospholipase L1-like esterase